MANFTMSFTERRASKESYQCVDADVNVSTAKQIKQVASGSHKDWPRRDTWLLHCDATTVATPVNLSEREGREIRIDFFP